MQVYNYPLYQFLEGSSKSFVIPVYQRDYAWQVANCQKLWADILELQSSNRKSHFLGTVVNIYDKGDERLIVDGQQRLTTVSLLLLAIHNYLKLKDNKSEIEARIQEQILNEFLINKYASDQSKKIRLKPNKEDRGYFEGLFKESSNKTNGSNIINNYNFFYTKIQSNEISIEQLFELFRKLEIVNIELDRYQDDPQLIFESLNSTGVDLTDGDLIRNYILMDLEPVLQEQVYSNYWQPIENLVGNIAEFIRIFLIFRLKSNVKQRDRDTYQKFVQYVAQAYQEDRTKVLTELMPFAKIYASLVGNKNYPDGDLDKAVSRINKLEFTVCYPFLLDLIYDYENEIITKEVVKKSIRLIESYGFRKILVDKTTQGLNKFFITLSKDIKSRENWELDYYNILSAILLSKSANLRFPNDEALILALETAEVYKFQSKNKNFLLDNLENYGNPIPADFADLTIEHIMPQQLRSEDREMLGENWQENHKIFVHTIGNLTLVSPSNNSRLSNKGFIEKSSLDYQSSRLRLNQELLDKQKWDFEEIRNRSKVLAAQACQIWPYPQTDYSIESKAENDRYEMDPEIDFTGKKPTKLIFQGQEHKVSSWKSVVIELSKLIYSNSPTEFKLLIPQSSIHKCFATSDDKSKLRSPEEFVTGHYVECNQSANSLVKMSSILIELFGIDPSEVEIEEGCKYLLNNILLNKNEVF